MAHRGIREREHPMQSRKRRLNFSLVLISLIIVVIGAVIVTTALRNTSPKNLQPAQASALTTMTDIATVTTIPTTPPAVANLEDDASQWGIFYDGGNALAKLQNISQPSVDGSALKISLLSGQPYTGIHAYRNLPANDTATKFDLKLFFSFSSVTPIQALEFTMNSWVNNQRWEWALQWENIGDGTTQQGNPPTWRLWTGRSWQNIGVRQQLSPKIWHKLHLKGDLLLRQVLTKYSHQFPRQETRWQWRCNWMVIVVRTHTKCTSMELTSNGVEMRCMNPLAITKPGKRGSKRRTVSIVRV